MVTLSGKIGAQILIAFQLLLINSHLFELQFIISLKLKKTLNFIKLDQFWKRLH